MSFQIYDEKTWPLDNPEEVSAGRAIQHVGRWKFGAEWDGLVHGISRTPMNPLPPQLAANGADLARAWGLLPESQLNQIPTIGSTRGNRIFLTPGQYQRAMDWIQEYNAVWEAAFLHLNEVKLEIRDACLAGKTHACVQLFNGRTLDVSTHLWKTDRFHRWFWTGRLSMLEATDDLRDSDEPSVWLFFNRAQLQQRFGGRADLDRENDNAIPKVGSVETDPERTVERLQPPVNRGEFTRRLREIISASPQKRTHTKEEFYDIAAECGIASNRQADLIRGQILTSFGEEVKSAWEKGGAPRNAEQQID